MIGRKYPEVSEVIETNLSQWPLVVTTYVGLVTATDVDECLAMYDRLLGAGPYGVLVMSRDVRPWESTVIQRHAAWIKANEAELRRLCVGMALVLPSLWQKGLLRAILWLQPIPQPHAVFGTAGEGMAWLGDRFRVAGIEAGVSATRTGGAVPSPPAEM